jgi:Fe-S-cluster containining protein
MQVYFTWPDRGVGYDCRGCGACCKGHGIGLDAAGGQLEQLLTLYPRATAFARRRGPAWTVFNPRDRCWFLDDGGLCRVEVDHGRAAKPAACKLFPFNRVFRVGDTLVVDFNSVICPVRAAAGDGEAHAGVLAEIESVTDAAIVGTVLPTESPSDDFGAREQPIADACFGAAAAADWSAAFASMSEADADAARGACAVALTSLTDQAATLPSRETLAAALLLTPSMRFNELYGPRQFESRAEMLATLPGMWLAWLMLAADGEAIAERALSMQELTCLWSEVAPMAYAIAHWGERPGLEPGPVELPGDAADPTGRVRAFAETCVRNRPGAKKRRPLGELWLRALQGHPAHERVALLKQASPILTKIAWS